MPIYPQNPFYVMNIPVNNFQRAFLLVWNHLYILRFQNTIGEENDSFLLDSYLKERDKNLRKLGTGIPKRTQVLFFFLGRGVEASTEDCS